MHQRAAVDDLITCKRAGKELSTSPIEEIVKSDANGANWPKGCYLQQSTTKVFFNHHSTGSKNNDAYHLCKFNGEGNNSYLTLIHLLIYLSII